MVASQLPSEDAQVRFQKTYVEVGLLHSAKSARAVLMRIA